MPALTPIFGALAGYALLMFTTPIRASLRDGWRAVRRYPALALTLGLFGFGYAAFELGLRIYFSQVLPVDERPVFVWTRAAFSRDAASWLGALWRLPPGALREAVRESALPAITGTAGLFNNLVSTFPLAALAAAALLVNRGGCQRVLLRALRQRFGARGWLVHAAILLGALAALAKPLLYCVARHVDAGLWAQWAPVLASVAFAFEYLFGVGVQVYLILLAHCWVRGITVKRDRLIDLSIKRFSFVVRWAAVVLALSTLFIDLPLILNNFPPFAGGFAPDPSTLDRRVALAHAVLSGVLLAFATVQITLVFHSESLRAALRDHGRWLRKNIGAYAWLIIVAGLHLFALHAADGVCRRGFGEGTALWVTWSLLFPWLAGGVGAWLLASWVCIYKRAQPGRAGTQRAVQF